MKWTEEQMLNPSGYALTKEVTGIDPLAEYRAVMREERAARAEVAAEAERAEAERKAAAPPVRQWWEDVLDAEYALCTGQIDNQPAAPAEQARKEAEDRPTLAEFARALFGESKGAKPLSVSEWAAKKLKFFPSETQAKVLDSDARFLLLCCNRQWGKSTTIALKALHRALHKPKESIVIISRTKPQAGILIEIAQTFAAFLRIPIRRVLGHPFSLKFPNGSKIFAVAHTMDTSVGNTATVLIVDEAALVKDDVYFYVNPAISRTTGCIWLMSTPRRQAGFFYNYWHNGGDAWIRIFANIDDCPEIDRQYLAMQKAADPIKYAQDFLCQFIQPADRLCNAEMVDNMRKPWDY